MFQQGKSSFTSCTHDGTAFSQGTKYQGDTGLVLSTDAKPRLKWSLELHERFVNAVNQLGGAEKATPKAIMRAMGIPSLTLYHLKSHLQKYRLSKHLTANANSSNKTGMSTSHTIEVDKISKAFVPYSTNICSGELHSDKNLQIGEALQMQIEVQRRLHEQLEVQRHLQLRIEAQGKYLQSVLQKAQETLREQNIGAAGQDVARAQLSNLVSKVPIECLDPPLSGSQQGAEGFSTIEQIQIAQLTDCSADSCLTSCEGAHKEQDTQKVGENLKTLIRNIPSEQKQSIDLLCFRQGDIYRGNYPYEKNLLSSSDKGSECTFFPIERNMTGFSMKSSKQDAGERWKEECTETTLSRQSFYGNMTHQEEVEENICSLAVSPKESKLDLNASTENSVASSFRRFDLNGFAWS